MERKSDTMGHRENYQSQNAIENLREAVKLAEDLKDNNKIWEANLNLGQAYLSNRQVQLATEYLGTAVEIAKKQKNQGQMAIAYLELGQAHQKNNEIHEAINCFEKVLKNGGKQDATNAHLALGDIFRSDDKISKAIQHYTKALKIAKEQKDTKGEMRSYFGLGDVYKLDNQIQKAINHYEIALDIARKHGKKRDETMACRWLGDAYRLGNQIQNAIQSYENALKIATEHVYKEEEPDIYIGLGHVYKQNNKLSAATWYFKKALKIAKELGDKLGETRAYCGLGDTYRLSNQIHASIQDYTEALKTAKEREYKQEETDIYIGLGHIYRQKKKFPQAIEYYKKALDIASDRQDKQGETKAYCGLGDAYTLNKQIRNAIEHYQKAINIAQKNGYKREEQKACFGLAGAYKLNNQFPEAIQKYEKALAIAKEQEYKLEETDTCIGLGHVYMEIIQIEKALKYYENALQIATKRHDEDGKKKANHYLRAATEALRIDKREQKANRTVKKFFRDAVVEKSNPSEDSDRQNQKVVDQMSTEKETISDRISLPENLLLMGRSYHEIKGKNKEAIKSYEQAVQAADEEGENDIKVTAYQHLGKIFTDTSEYEKAIENYEKARESYPGLKANKMEVVPYEWLGYNHLQAGKYQDSIECYNKVVTLATQLGENQKVFNAYIGLGNAFNYIGEIDSSESYFIKALTVASQLKHERLEREAHTHIAQVYYNHGKFDAAVKSYIKVQEISHDLGEKLEEANACLMLGRTFQQLKQHKDAIEYYRKAIEFSKELDDKKMHARAVQKLGALFLSLASDCNNDIDYKMAIEWYKKALAIFETEPIDYLQHEKALIGLGIAYFHIGDTEKAIICLRKAEDSSVDILHERIKPQEQEASFSSVTGDSTKMNITDTEENLREPNATTSQGQLEETWVDKIIKDASNPGRTERLHTKDLVRLENYIKDVSPSYLYTRQISVNKPFTEKVRKAMTEDVKMSAYRSLLGKNVHKLDAKDATFADSDQEILNFAKDEVSRNASTKRPARLNETLTSYMRSVGIVVIDRVPCGTCFLVTNTMAITNYHVYRIIQEVRSKPENSNLPIRICFDYLDREKPEKVVVVEIDEQEDLCKLENPYLDYKFLHVKQNEHLRGRDPLGPMVRNWQLSNGRVVILGHPGGEEMQDEVCIVVGYHKMLDRLRERHERFTGVHMTNEQLLRGLKNQKLSSHTKTYFSGLSYDTTFFSGASGSPVIELNGNIVAMHTQGYVLGEDVRNQLENVADQKHENVHNQKKKYSLMEFGVQFFSIFRDIRCRYGESVLKKLFPNYEEELMDTM